MRRRSRKRAQSASEAQLSGPLSLTDDARRPASEVEAYDGSGGSPACGIAPPSEPLSEEAIFERTSESGWYTVDDDGLNRPVAYRRTPRFDDRSERTATPRMLFKSVEELPEWVQASNRLWLVRLARPRPPSTSAVRVLNSGARRVLTATLFRFRGGPTARRVACWPGQCTGGERAGTEFTR